MNYAELYDEVRRLIQNGDWTGIDQLLLTLSVFAIDRPNEVTTLITLLTLCLPVKSKLYHYTSVRRNAAHILGNRAEAVLKGL